MGSAKQCPDPAVLREMLDYAPESGALTWKSGNYRGHIAGTADRAGYVRVILAAKSWPAHRLAWVIYYGEQPPAMIDHVNGNRGDNRIVNLRAATRSENNANSTKTERNKSGFKGVSLHKKSGRWQACIKIGGKSKHLGLFTTAEDAHAAYCAAARDLFGQYARPE